MCIRDSCDFDVVAGHAFAGGDELVAAVLHVAAFEHQRRPRPIQPRAGQLAEVGGQHFLGGVEQDEPVDALEHRCV